MSLDDQASAETRDYRGFNADGYCGQKADLLEPERAVLLHTPGLVPFWKSDWESEPAFGRFWFRCPLTPGHEGPHGTYLGTRRWYSRDFWYPGDIKAFDGNARHWYLIWGPEETDHRVLGPIAHCDGRKPATGDVDGEWSCSLWRQHPGECKHHFIETLDFDFGEYEELDADEIATWEVERAKMQEDQAPEVLADYLSGDASQWELVDGHYLSPEEVRELIAKRTTADERAEARRRRSRKLRAQQDAMEKLWALEMARQPGQFPSLVRDNVDNPAQAYDPPAKSERNGSRGESEGAVSSPEVPPDVVAMIERRRQGWTLEDIGTEVGLSRERVRQLLKKYGGPSAEEVRDLRASEALTAQSELESAVAAQIRSALDSRGPMTVAELVEATALDAGDVFKFWPQELSHLRLHQAGNHENRWSDDAILDAIREAALYEFPLTTKAYADLVSQGQIKGPSMPRIWQRFGSWTAACEAAGVVAGQTMRPHYESRWSDDDLLQFARQYLLDPDSPNSAHRFDEWKRACAPDGPSFQTLRNRFGSWTEVKRRALARGGKAR